MLHNLSNQVSYFSKLIQTNDSWIYVGVYSDEAKTCKMMISQMLAWFRIYRDLGDNGFKVHRQGNRTKSGVDGTPKDPKLNKR